MNLKMILYYILFYCISEFNDRMPYRKWDGIFAALAVWYETCYESLYKPSLVTAPPVGQSAKVSVAKTSCISEVPLCAILDLFCIWFCLFRFSSFSVGWIVIKIGSGQTQTKTKPHKYNYWILFSRKALTVLLAKTPNRKWVITLAKLLRIDTQFFFVSTPHCPENIMHISSATYWSKVINQKICSVIQYPIGVWPCSCYLQLYFLINP